MRRSGTSAFLASTWRRRRIASPRHRKEAAVPRWSKRSRCSACCTPRRYCLQRRTRRFQRGPEESSRLRRPRPQSRPRPWRRPQALASGGPPTRKGGPWRRASGEAGTSSSCWGPMGVRLRPWPGTTRNTSVGTQASHVPRLERARIRRKSLCLRRFAGFRDRLASSGEPTRFAKVFSTMKRLRVRCRPPEQAGASSA